MGPQRLVTFVISALEMFLLTYLLTYTVSQKMHQLWNDIAQSYKDQFWWNLAEIFKTLEWSLYVSVFTQVCFFINFLSFKPDTENNANFDAVPSKQDNFDAI